MASMEQFFSALGVLVALTLGAHAIITRRVAIGNEDDEPHLWFYGWRAVLIGCFSILLSLLFFASCLGFVHLDWQ